MLNGHGNECISYHCINMLINTIQYIPVLILYPSHYTVPMIQYMNQDKHYAVKCVDE